MKQNLKIQFNLLSWPSLCKRNLFTLLNILCCVGWIGYTEEVQAQSIAPPIDSYISIGNESVIVYIDVIDTTEITEIEIAMGSSSNESNLFENIYAFDQVNGLSGGMTYSRTGNRITLGTGTIQLSPVIFSKVRLKNFANEWSSWQEFVSN